MANEYVSTISIFLSCCKERLFTRSWRGGGGGGYKLKLFPWGPWEDRLFLQLSCRLIASQADRLRSSSRVPAPQTSAESSVKNVDQSQHTSRSGKCTLDLENFRARLSSRIDQKDPERWRPYTFRTNYSINSHAFVLETALTISLKNLPYRFNFLNGSRLYYKTIKCEKKILPFVQLQRTTPPLPHPQNTSMSKWHLVQPLQRETHTKRQPLSPKYSCPELNSLITYHTLPSLNVCVWLVNIWTLTAPIGSSIICTSAPADICEQRERNLTPRFIRRLCGSNARRTP